MFAARSCRWLSRRSVVGRSFEAKSARRTLCRRENCTAPWTDSEISIDCKIYVYVCTYIYKDFMRHHAYIHIYERPALRIVKDCKYTQDLAKKRRTRALRTRLFRNTRQPSLSRNTKRVYPSQVGAFVCRTQVKWQHLVCGTTAVRNNSTAGSLSCVPYEERFLHHHLFIFVPYSALKQSLLTSRGWKMV